MTEASIDYGRILSEVPHGDVEVTIAFLSEVLPYEWADVYRRLNPHRANIWRVPYNGFEYLFDHSSELVAQGEVSEEEVVEDRLVAVHGRSQVGRGNRRDSLMRKHPLGPIHFINPQSRIKYDKGHFIAHSLGGGLHINLFPQSTAVNRGWSESGKLFRSMERYCQEHPGIYCFSRPLYKGHSFHPYEIEYGVLKADETLWVNSFPNCGTAEEFAEIERLFRERLSGTDGVRNS
jgi:hypothetical protein